MLFVLLALAFPFSISSGSAVTGQVVDPSSRPVAGAQVLVVCGATIASQSVTGGDGRFTTHAADGRCELRIAAEGMAAAPVALDLTNGEPRDLGTITLAISAIAESVVVSAAQADVPLSQSSSAVTVITGNELRARQLTTVADALREVPGLSVARTGTAGAVTGVFPRGGESDYSLVFIDGVEVNGFGGGFDFAHLSTDNVERIEVVRGPQSALYGSNAIGAVIRIVTRHGGPVVANGVFEAGSLGGSRMNNDRAAVSTSGSHNGWSWGGGAENVNSSGWNGGRADDGETITNDDYTRQNAGGSAGWRNDQGAMLRGDLQFEHDERGFPGAFGSNPIGAFTGIDTVSRGIDNRWTGSLAGGLPTGRRVQTHVQTTWNADDGTFASPFGPSDSADRRWTVRGQSDIHVRAGLDVSAGAEFLREKATSTFITDDSDAEIPVRRSMAGYFGEARWASDDRLFVTAGLRVEDIRRDTLAGFADPFSPRPAFGENRVVSTNPRVAVAWFARPDAGSSTKLRAAAGTGIRPPDAFEIAFTDNPSLKPERSRSVEAGVDQAFAGGHGLIEATAFRNTFDDLIVAVGSFQQSSRFRTDNISNARASGLELAGTARARTGSDGPARAADLHVSRQRSAGDRQRRDGRASLPCRRSAAAPAAPAVVGRRQRHLAARHGLAPRRGTGRVLDVEPTEGTFGGLFYASGYDVWNTGAGWTVARGIEVFGRVENLLDRRYEEAFGFPALGRKGIVGIRIAARH